MHYDINGLRTQKGNTHYYYDTANNLIAMVKGNDTRLREGFSLFAGKGDHQQEQRLDVMINTMTLR